MISKYFLKSVIDDITLSQSLLWRSVHTPWKVSLGSELEDETNYMVRMKASPK